MSSGSGGGSQPKGPPPGPPPSLRSDWNKIVEEEEREEAAAAVVLAAGDGSNSSNLNANKAADSTVLVDNVSTPAGSTSLVVPVESSSLPETAATLAASQEEVKEESASEPMDGKKRLIIYFDHQRGCIGSRYID